MDILFCMAQARKGFKALSPRSLPEKTQIRLPKELMDWVKAKAQKEGKSLSLLITEILETARQKEEEKGQDNA